MRADSKRERCPSAVVLLSGGLDSATVLAIAQERGFACHALTFRYGQRHSEEIAAARRVATNQGAKHHRVVELPINELADSALTDDDRAIPQDRSSDELADDIPATYVPARNTIFLSCALAHAESTGSGHVFCGVNAVDYSGYPDCRPEFIEAFQNLARLATKQAVEGAPTTICAPLQGMNKGQIIRHGSELGVDYSLTSSCYDPDARGRACGHCDACLLRKQGFKQAGIQDPTQYH